MVCRHLRTTTQIDRRDVGMLSRCDDIGVEFNDCARSTRIRTGCTRETRRLVYVSSVGGEMLRISSDQVKTPVAQARRQVNVELSKTPAASILRRWLRGVRLVSSIAANPVLDLPEMTREPWRAGPFEDQPMDVQKVGFGQFLSSYGALDGELHRIDVGEDFGRFGAYRSPDVLFGLGTRQLSGFNLEALDLGRGDRTRCGEEGGQEAGVPGAPRCLGEQSLARRRTLSRRGHLAVLSRIR